MTTIRSARDEHIYFMVSWSEYLNLKKSPYVFPIDPCRVCHSFRAGNVIMEGKDHPRGPLGVATICSEECFNLWLMHRMVVMEKL